jgi:hypothetical protein
MTINSPVSLSRRHVLGDLYSRCTALTDEIPVYLEGDDREVLGHANQQLGAFADAISFFLSEGNCKKLASGGFRFAVDYDNSTADSNVNSRRVVVTSITLLAPKNYEKPVPRHG